MTYEIYETRPGVLVLTLFSQQITSCFSTTHLLQSRFDYVFFMMSIDLIDVFMFMVVGCRLSFILWFYFMVVKLYKTNRQPRHQGTDNH